MRSFSATLGIGSPLAAGGSHPADQVGGLAPGAISSEQSLLQRHSINLIEVISSPDGDGDGDEAMLVMMAMMSALRNKGERRLNTCALSNQEKTSEGRVSVVLCSPRRLGLSKRRFSANKFAQIVLAGKSPRPPRSDHSFGL